MCDVATPPRRASLLETARGHASRPGHGNTCIGTLYHKLFAFGYDIGRR